jgi:hypothetical protein
MADIPTVRSLDELTDLASGRSDLYLRWSRGPDVDAGEVSRDELTGVELPGLSVSALAVEPWWRDHPARLWIARRIYDYQHLQSRRAGARPWVLAGRECGRGPDNEPLVKDFDPVAWIDMGAVCEARELIDGMDREWGPLDRAGPPFSRPAVR